MTQRNERDVNSHLTASKKRQYKEAFPEVTESDDRTEGKKFFKKGEKIVEKYCKGVDFCKEKITFYEELKPAEKLLQNLKKKPESLFKREQQRMNKLLC